MERRLAAVLIADVVGYGRLSQVDEEGTRARFQADLNEVFGPKITAHRGRLIKTMGDGLLVEFASVVDALRCAVEAQQEKAKRNAAAPPGERLDFRIGVNLGDIIVEGEDIHGDGVNIADRMQALAEPGGVAISGTAYDQVKAKLPVGYVSLGSQKVKSIAEPVRVYRLLMDPAAAGKTVGAKRNLRAHRIPAAVVAIVALAVAGAAAWWQPWTPNDATNVAAADTRPSLVVLPFENLSEDTEQGYLADGIAEDLTTDLARVPGLFVISRKAAFVYKGEAVPPSEIASNLGVRYILEGSIRRAGGDLRINAQLIDAGSGGHLWAERFDGAFAEVFALQDKVVAAIVGALELRLVADWANAPGGTHDPAAYEAYLRGLELYGRHWREPEKTAQNLIAARPHLERAIALDPTYGQAHALLAEVYWKGDWEEFGIPSDDALTKYNEHLQLGMKYNAARGFRLAAATSQGFDDAIEHLERAVALDPSDVDNYGEMAQWLVRMGRTADAKRYLDTAIRLDPRAEDYWGDAFGLLSFSEGDFTEAAGIWEEHLASYPRIASTHMLLVSAYAHLGRAADAARHLAAARETDGRTILWAKSAFPYKEDADAERLAVGLRIAGVPELPFGYDPTSAARLTGNEIESLIAGHTIVYREIAGEGRQASTAFEADGTALLTRGHITEAGHPIFDEDGVCFWWRKEARECVAVFRNPVGTREAGNEYSWVNPWTQWAFSVVD